jgi:hypothetical protein
LSLPGWSPWCRSRESTWRAPVGRTACVQIRSRWICRGVFAPNSKYRARVTPAKPAGAVSTPGLKIRRRLRAPNDRPR